jgi:hypothetical protein
MLLLEDIVGTRQARSQARTKGQSDTVQLGQGGTDYGGFPPPTLEYVLEFMTLVKSSSWKGVIGEEKLVWGKLLLLTSMLAREPAGSAKWSTLSITEEWTQQVEGSIRGAGSHGAYGATLMSIINLIRATSNNNS